MTAARNAAEIVVPIVVVTADAAPVEEAVAEDADAVVPDAEAAAVSAAVDTAQAATNQRPGLVGHG